MPAARSAQATGPPVLVGAGDISDCLQSRDTQTDQIVKNIVAADPNAMVFTVGDNAYSDGSGSVRQRGRRARAFTKAFDPAWGKFGGMIHPAPGNHGYYYSSVAQGYFDCFNGAGSPPDSPAPAPRATTPSTRRGRANGAL